jgi:hypothetical protein
VAVTLSNGAHLGGEGQGNLVAVGLSEDDLDLLNGVGSIFKLGDVEALALLDVTANDLGDLDGLGDAVLDRLRGSDIDGEDEGAVDEWHGVLLGLVLFPEIVL